MPAVSVVASVTALTMADPAACDRAGLAALVATSQQVRNWLDAFDARIAVHALRLGESGSCEPPASLLAAGGRRAARDAEAAAARGVVCDSMPSVHDALAAGAVSAGHVDAIARVAVHLDDAGRAALCDLEPTLVAAATSSPVEAFEREVRDLGRVLSRDDGVRQHERLRRQRSLRRWMDRQTGMCHSHLALDPEADARLSAALDVAVAAEQVKPEGATGRTFDQLRADAMVALATGARSGDRRPPEISVLIDLATLRGRLHEHSVSETADGHPLPPATVRRLACEAEIVPVVLDGAGVALFDVGRSSRVATPAQRRALRAMYRTCGLPGCGVRFADCEIHHVLEWDRHGGATDLANLLPVCSRHHHLVHEGGWRLTLRSDRRILLVRPDGARHVEGSGVDVAPAGVAPKADRDGDLEDAVVVALVRARLRALGPPARAPAA